MNEAKESQFSTPKRPCHVCKTKTEKTCERCKYALQEINREHMATYYCGKKCADHDWQRHRRECRRATRRRQLYRAASLIQFLFYETRSAAFDINIERVETDPDSKSRLIGWKGRENSELFDFPGCVSTQKRPGRSILSWSASRIAVSRFYEMLDTCIKGMYDEFVEVSVRISPQRQRVVFRTEEYDVLNCEGVVFRVKLRDDHISYAVDPAGAEFGQHAPILEWDDYIKKISPSSMKVNAHGSCAEIAHAQEKLRYERLQNGGRMTIDQDCRKDLMQSYVTNLMNLVVDEWLRERNINAVEGLNRQMWLYGIKDMADKINDEIKDLLAAISLNGGICAFDFMVYNALSDDREELGVEDESVVIRHDGSSTELSAGFIASLKQMRL